MPSFGYLIDDKQDFPEYFYKYIICDSCLLLVEERGWLRPSVPFETLLLINGETYKGSASKTYGNTDDPAFVGKVNEARIQAYV